MVAAPHTNTSVLTLDLLETFRPSIQMPLLPLPNISDASLFYRIGTHTAWDVFAIRWPARPHGKSRCVRGIPNTTMAIEADTHSASRQ